MGWVDSKIDDAVDFITEDIPNKIQDEIIEPTKEFGSSLDDFVNEKIPGGWYTVAAATGAYFAPEMIAAGNAAEATALAEGATAAEAAAAGTSAASGGTNYLGSQALGNASTGAVGSGATGVGLSAGTASGGAAAGTGISTGSLAGTSLGAGMGGVGTNASSGLGYLGGSSSLPSGTAGITGVTATPSLSIQDALRGANQLNNLLGQQPTPQGGMPKQQIRPTGAVDYSGILSLLEQKAKRPNILSLLG
jgi:hypothetical protein